MSYRIITIEDDLLLAEDLKQRLFSLGYTVLANATTAMEAVQLTREHQPDILIVDIHISGEQDGIDAVTLIYQQYRCPIIYLTANSESATVKRALATHPSAFLLKPFKVSEFAINIDLAIKNFRNSVTFQTINHLLTDSIFLPQDFLYYRVRKQDIFFVEADGSYVKVYTKEKRYHVTVNLKSFERQLNDTRFLRISRKHLINTEYVARINGNAVYLNLPEREQLISMSKEQRQDLLQLFSLVKTRE